MPRIIAEFDMNITPANPECDRIIALMREHSLECLRIQAICNSGKIDQVTEEEKERYNKRRDEIGKLLIPCFADNPWKLSNMTWNTREFLTQEEESLLVPPG